MFGEIVFLLLVCLIPLIFCSPETEEEYFNSLLNF